MNSLQLDCICRISNDPFYVTEAIMIFRLVQHITQGNSNWDYCVDVLAALPNNH